MSPARAGRRGPSLASAASRVVPGAGATGAAGAGHAPGRGEAGAAVAVRAGRRATGRRDEVEGASRVAFAFNPGLARVAAVLATCGLSSDDVGPEHPSDFVLAHEGPVDVGVAGLQVFGTEALVRSVGVLPGRRSRGLGAELLAAIEGHARSRGVRQLYLLTTDAQPFFAQHGFSAVPRSSAPARVQGSTQFGSTRCGSATLMAKTIDS